MSRYREPPAVYFAAGFLSGLVLGALYTLFSVYVVHATR